MSAEINREEWLAELTRLSVPSSPTDDGHHTVNEFAAATGWSVQRVRRSLAQAKALGRLSQRVRRGVNLAGTVCWTPTYLVLAEAKDTAKRRR